MDPRGSLAGQLTPVEVRQACAFECAFGNKLHTCHVINHKGAEPPLKKLNTCANIVIHLWFRPFVVKSYDRYTIYFQRRTAVEPPLSGPCAFITQIIATG